MTDRLISLDGIEFAKEKLKSWNFGYTDGLQEDAPEHMRLLHSIAVDAASVVIDDMVERFQDADDLPVLLKPSATPSISVWLIGDDLIAYMHLTAIFEEYLSITADDASDLRDFAFFLREYSTKFDAAADAQDIKDSLNK